MSEEKTYLASDLVNELGVARSTINDWLTRYADYLESEARGKRRVYTARSLEVLRHICYKMPFSYPPDYHSVWVYFFNHRKLLGYARA